MTETRKPREPFKLSKPVNPAYRAASKRWSDHPTAVDFTNYADYHWVEKFNEHSRAGNKIAALGWLLAGQTRKSFMTRYDIVGRNEVAPRMSDAQKQTISRFETVQKVTNIIKRALEDSETKKRRPKEPLRHRIARYKDVFDSARAKRRERIDNGGGLFNTAFSTFVPDKGIENAYKSKVARQYGPSDEESAQQGVAEKEPKNTFDIGHGLTVDFDQARDAGLDAVEGRLGPITGNETNQELNARKAIAAEARKKDIQGQLDKQRADFDAGRESQGLDPVDHAGEPDADAAIAKYLEAKKTTSETPQASVPDMKGVKITMPGFLKRDPDRNKTFEERTLAEVAKRVAEAEAAKQASVSQNRNGMPELSDDQNVPLSTLDESVQWDGSDSPRGVDGPKMR